MTLWLYLTRRFLMNVLKVELAVFFLILLLNATEEMRFLSGKDADVSTTIWLVTSSLPKLIMTTLPLVVLLGSLFTFIGLSRSSELVVMRSTGISALRILTVPALAAIVLGIISVTIFNPIVAATIRKNLEIRDSFSASGRSQLSVSREGIWLRQANPNGYIIIHARASSGQGVVLFNVSFHEFDQSGALSRRIEAQRTHLNDGEWVLYQATQWRFLERDLTDTIDIRPFDELSVPTTLTPEDILESFDAPEKISIWKTPAFIRQLEASGFTAVSHKIYMQSQLALPLLLVAMVMVGSVFALRPSRFGNTGLMVLLAIMSGFLTYTVTNIAISLGEAQQIPINLAAWAPAVAMLLLALTALLHLEDG